LIILFMKGQHFAQKVGVNEFFKTKIS
jgi:hypothetical protein